MNQTTQNTENTQAIQAIQAVRTAQMVARTAAESAMTTVQLLTLYLKNDCRKNFSGRTAYQLAKQTREGLEGTSQVWQDWNRLSYQVRLPWLLAAQLMVDRPKITENFAEGVCQQMRLGLLPATRAKVERCRQILAGHVITRIMRAAPYRIILSKVREAATTVYQTMDWGWNEKHYQEALKTELDGLVGQYWTICSEIPHTISYGGRPMGDGVNVRTDILLTERRYPGRRIILELKAVSEGRSAMLKAVQQCKRYISMLEIPVGMVINFPDRPSLRPKTQLVLRSWGLEKKPLSVRHR